MNKINYRHEYGKTVYFTKSVSIPTYRPCPLCDGVGELESPEKKTKTVCPKCDGNKEITTSGSIKHIVFRGTVSSVVIVVNNNGTEIHNDVEYYDGDEKLLIGFNQDALYTHIKDADIEADKNNNLGVMGYTS